jgi:hypothetical protein
LRRQVLALPSPDLRAIERDVLMETSNQFRDDGTR